MPCKGCSASGTKPVGTVTWLCSVVRSIVPGSLAPSTESRSRFSGQSICSIEVSKTFMRAATAGLVSNSRGPTVLLSRKGAVDHRLISEGTRV